MKTLPHVFPPQPQGPIPTHPRLSRLLRAAMGAAICTAVLALLIGAAYLLAHAAIFLFGNNWAVVVLVWLTIFLGGMAWGFFDGD